MLASMYKLSSGVRFLFIGLVFSPQLIYVWMDRWTRMFHNTIHNTLPMNINSYVMPSMQGINGLFDRYDWKRKMQLNGCMDYLEYEIVSSLLIIFLQTVFLSVKLLCLFTVDCLPAEVKLLPKVLCYPTYCAAVINCWQSKPLQFCFTG